MTYISRRLAVPLLLGAVVLLTANIGGDLSAIAQSDAPPMFLPGNGLIPTPAIA